MNLDVNSINGSTLNKTIQTAGNNLYSFDAATFEGQSLNPGFTLTGTVTLTFTGTIPYGSRLNFAVTAGNTTCATQQQKQLGYIYSDHLDTPRLITNQQNQALWSWDGDPFGTTNANENPSNLGTFNFNLRFPGQYYDQEAKTHYNVMRDYDPATGRYIQSDPIGLAGGLNLYGYANADPVSYYDRDGAIPLLGLALRGFISVVRTVPKAPPITQATAILVVPPVATSVETSRTLTFPDIRRRMWTCTCLADCDDRIPDNCSDNASKRFAFGTASASTFSEAVKLGKRAATQILACQPKHIPCNCTGPNGEQRRAQ